MKRKIISSTYLRDVSKFQIKLYLDQDDYYISVKKLIKVEEKFIIKDNLCVMDDGYYIVEVVPKNENYAMRLFLDERRRPLEYYFDICKNNGLDPDTLIPYFDDLYLDITVLYDGTINILDEDELDDAVIVGDVSKKDYELVMQTKEVLLKEIESGTNRIMNIDFSNYLF